MKFYLDSVQYNKEKKEENRSQTKMFADRQSAESAYHKSVGSDMSNSTLGGSVTVLYNSDGGLELIKKWGFMSEDERPTEVVAEA